MNGELVSALNSLQSERKMRNDLESDEKGYVERMGRTEVEADSLFQQVRCVFHVAVIAHVFALRFRSLSFSGWKTAKCVGVVTDRAFIFFKYLSYIT